MSDDSCKICKEKHYGRKIIIKFPFLSFISGDYKYIKSSKFYNFCPNTNFVFTNINQTWFKNIDKIYKNYNFFIFFVSFLLFFLFSKKLFTEFTISSLPP